jgi:voltage-dependent potassium channel beta subunit
MKYRYLGASGIQVSELSFGSWVTFSHQVNQDTSIELIKYAYDNGINFFDNAEVYAHGESEELMGKAFKKLGLRRSSYLVSTKLYWGLHTKPNEKNTLNRKYLIEGINSSLKRLDLEYVDLLFCHRPDPFTPLEETVYAMNDIITSGKALYWGTSEWSAEEIRGAWEIADKRNLRKPIMEQPQYNLFHRERFEKEYARIFNDLKIGSTIWSPLASGLLTGKYNDGIPKDSRGALSGYEWLTERLSDKDKIEKVKQLAQIADDLDTSITQLSIAWCLKNKNVSTVILGASKLPQLQENLQASLMVERITDEVMDRIETVLK